VKERPLADGIP